MKTLIRLLLLEQSDQGLHFLSQFLYFTVYFMLSQTIDAIKLDQITNW